MSEKEKIEVSIICNTYNQEEYIADAIESFLMQKTKFKFEILIHDDASTDHTVDIIKTYEKKYPDIIKPIYQKENQYSKNVSINLNYQYPRVKGKYIAVCEGDDYWTDPFKLQKQFEFLEKTPQVDMCAHGAVKVDATTKKILEDITPCSYQTIIPVEDVIMGEGGFFATNSLMYRTQINDNILEFRKYFGLDYTLQIHGALRGGIVYIPDIMSAYRWLAKGSWTSRQISDRTKRRDHLQRKNKMLDILDKETNGIYHNTIKTRKCLNDFIFSCKEREYKKIISHQYKEAYKYLGGITTCKYILKMFFPCLDGITNRKKEY